MLNFDADVKKTTARHQCENRLSPGPAALKNLPCPETINTAEVNDVHEVISHSNACSFTGALYTAEAHFRTRLYTIGLSCTKYSDL